MIFVALPALQRSQRDTQRKSDIASLKAAITQYRTNNKGQLPNYVGLEHRSKYIHNASDSNTDLGFLNNYWRPTMYDTIEILPTSYGWAEVVPVNIDGMVIHMGGKCEQLDNGTWTTGGDMGTRNGVAIYVILESIAPAKDHYGNVGANYCEDV